MKYKFYIFSFTVLLQGCATPGWQSIKLQDYLQPYIGQSAESIQKNLDLRELGFQTTQRPKKTDQTLTYTVLCPINIPIPITQSMGSSYGTSARLTTTATYGQSYDINFYCHIIFELDQQQIARSIQYEGRAC